MKHALQALVLAAAFATGAAQADKAATMGIDVVADTLTAFNFPKITYSFGGRAAHEEEEADKAATPDSDVQAGTLTCLNFPKITFIHALV
jgi:hypothetical protein